MAQAPDWSCRNTWSAREVAVKTVVNLTKARKQRARAEAQAQAAQNRITHGRTKAERAEAEAAAAQASRKLDGHKREPQP
jgi:hypothetical protein